MERPNTLVIGILVTIVAAFGPLGTDLYLAAQPQMVGALGTDIASVQLTLSVFMVGFALGQAVVGPLSDRFGRRPVLLAGATLFVLASVGSAMAATIDQLIAMRFVQALGAASGPVLGRAVVRDLYERTEAARMLSFMSSAIAVAPLIGPVVGGFVTFAFGWRANFWVLAGFGLVALVGVAGLLQETNRFRDPAATGPLRIIRNYRVLLSHRAYIGYTGACMFAYAGLFAFISGSSFVLIGQMGLAPYVFGFAFASAAAGYIVGTQIGARLVRRAGIDRLCMIGGAWMAANGLTMSVLAILGLAMPGTVVLPMGSMMVGVGLLLPNATAGAVAPFPRMAGTASALLGLMQFGFAAGVGALVGVLQGDSAVPMATIIGLCATGSLAMFLLFAWPVRREESPG